MSNPALAGQMVRRSRVRRARAVLSALGGNFARYMELRRMIAELERLDERMLRDIGLEGDQLRFRRPDAAGADPWR